MFFITKRSRVACHNNSFAIIATLAVIANVEIVGTPTQAADDRFASSVVSTTGNFNNGLYRTPAALLGKPTTYIRDQFPTPGGQVNGSVAASMVFAPYNRHRTERG